MNAKMWRLAAACSLLLISIAAGVAQMQSRAVDTRVQFQVLEEQRRGAPVGTIPIKAGFTYRFNEAPMEFTLDGQTGAIRTNVVLDREALPSDRFDLVVLSSQPTYPIEVRIVVADVNDNAPHFPEPVIAVAFSESAAPGTRLLLDSATDADIGRNVVDADEYRIVAGNSDGAFKLLVTANPTGDTTYLHLETTGKLDRETQSVYTLNISAKDGGVPPRFGYLQVNVSILDVNDNPPMFDQSDYIVSLNETVPPGTSVLKVTATDIDLGDNAKITYYLADDERQFAVDPETGAIATIEVLRCPQQTCTSSSATMNNVGCPKSCVFTVFARDHGSPRQDGRTYVTVNLLDTNDHSPVIEFAYLSMNAVFASVNENADQDAVVAAVRVNDMDQGLNGETTIRIVAGNELNHFRLNYTTDNVYLVRVNGVLDREEISTYNLSMLATDRGTPPRSATAYLVIHVNDVNDHEPVFEKTEYSAVLSEFAPPGFFVASIKATDEDSGLNSQILYAFVSGNQHDWFDMNAESGLIVTKAMLDREVQGSVELNISARDGGPNPKWAYTQLKVTILDENDEAPKFAQSMINVSLSEGTMPKTLIATVAAADHDQGTNGSVTYSLDPRIEHSFPGAFALDMLTGQLSTKMRLDRERIAFYEISVIARDQGVPPQSSTAVVRLTIEDVNDNGPVFYPLRYFVTIPDRTSMASNWFAQVYATDADEGRNADITYHLMDSGEDNGLFGVDPKLGRITLKGDLMRMSKRFFRLKVTAKDGGGRSCSENAVIEILKESFVEDVQFENFAGYDFRIVEDMGTGEARRTNRNVGRVQAQAHDTENVLSFYIIDGDRKHIFAIDEMSGRLSLVKTLDREEQTVYNLRVAARGGVAYGETAVNVTVLDLNDNEPRFSRERFDAIELPENTAVGQEVFWALARDADEGDNSKITYGLSYNPSDLFLINTATGVIFLNKPLAADPGTLLHLEVVASDSGAEKMSAKQSIHMIVTDVNDHTPVFDHTSYETSVLESTALNTRFFALSASDQDHGSNGLITFAIVEGNVDDKFGVFPNGLLHVRRELDREERDYYALTVCASDMGTPSRSSFVPVTIHILDENDNAPQFTNKSFSFTIMENEHSDAFVGKLTALDRDVGRNAELIYYIGDAQSLDFLVDPKNGFIRTRRTFDREQLVASTGKDFLTFEAVVSDNGHPQRLTDKVAVKVFIADVNDNTPKFQRAHYKVVLSEGVPVGTAVVRLHAIDADEGLNGDVFYEIRSGDDGGAFEVDVATGQITTAQPLDRERRDAYTLSVLAHDAASLPQMVLSAETTVHIDIQDENDHAPQFAAMESTSIQVLETAEINSALAYFNAVDLDIGINSEISYAITGGNRKDTFRIDPGTGVLFLHKPLDYEELHVFHLNITATDNGSPAMFSMMVHTVHVTDVNDNPPSFPNTAIVRQIREGIRIHTPIVTVTAEDRDSGSNGLVTYAIHKQTPHDDRRHFAINAQTGVIHTLLPIDRETIDTFRLIVVATDEAEPVRDRLSAEKLVTVIVEDINDNAPVFASMNAAILPLRHRRNQIAERLRLGDDNDAQIMRVYARDMDSDTNGRVTYELVGDQSDLFHVHRSSGALTLKKSLPHPAHAKYKLGVRATDEAVQSERKSTDTYITIVIDQDQNADVDGFHFHVSNYTGSIAENEAVGTSILTLRAVMDARRSGDNVTIEYYVTNVLESRSRQQVDRLFDIDVHFGVLTTAGELDCDSGADQFEVSVIALAIFGTTTGSPFSRIIKTKVHVSVVDKNDSPPSFENVSLSFNASEDLARHSLVARIHARDPDTSGDLHYMLLDHDVGVFELAARTGELRVRGALDRELKDHYQLVVRVSDGVQHTDGLVTVMITDTNDNPPAFSEAAYSFDVPENAMRGHRVGQVHANDADMGANARITYAVISDWANDVFALNAQTGVFTLTAPLDYEEVQHYILVVQAQDEGHPALSSTTTVYCNVIDLNDNAPMFDPISYTQEVFENVNVSTQIFTLTAADLDSGANGKIAYAIVSGDDNNEFAINENGTLITNKGLDRETKSVYNLHISATDQAQFPEKRHSTTAQATIIVKDVNDMWPQFTAGTSVSVFENAPLNTIVSAIKAVDPDDGRNGYIEYFFADDLAALDDDNGGDFSLGPMDGLLRVTGRIDRERRASYELHVIAKDRGDPPHSTATKITVSVIDENDNSPIFDPKQYSATIAENASIGASVLMVSATDIDAGLNGRVRFSIVDGDGNRDFSIAEDTGVIRVAKNLNFERKTRYKMTVKAEDCARDLDATNAPRSDLAQVTIVVTDINDNPPTFLDSPYLVFVTESVVPPKNGFFLRVQAYDADTPPFNSLVRYFIKEGDSDYFKINSSSGELSLLRALDREVRAEYTLVLVAMDSGSPPLTGSGTVKVVVQDVNDNSPEFKSPFHMATINENQPAGTLIAIPRATDADAGLNAKLRYSLSGDRHEISRFRIDEQTGAISSNAVLDREEQALYSFTLIAQDCSATDPKASAMNLTIAIEDENDNAPTFSSLRYYVLLSEKTQAGQFVFGANAIDRDANENARLTYTLAGDSASDFRIDAQTGVVRAQRDLNALGTSMFHLRIEAIDGGRPPKSAMATLHIELTASNQYPSFEVVPAMRTQLSIAENTEEGRVIARLHATSPKMSAAARIQYHIAGGNMGNALQIDKDTGEVQVASGGLDYETAATYEVWFEARDSDAPALASVVSLKINVSDANDNAPILSQRLYNVSLMEEESPPMLVAHITATDIDSGDNGRVRYRLTNDYDGAFEMDEDEGTIYTTTKLDREDIASYELAVEAIDRGTPPLSSSASVLVNVLDKNDNPPRFTRLFSVNVTENAEIGEFVIQVTSADLDVGENANATYSFTDNPGNKFRIDATTGVVSVVGLLDREQQDEFVLRLVAVDGSWRAETPLTITIQDQNDNAPEFEHSFYTFNFPELQPSATSVGQVLAADRDKQGPNSAIGYSLQQPSDVFSVDPVTGEVLSKQANLKYKHAHMEPSPENVYSLTIIATDNGKPPMSSECAVLINVVDANNNAPRFENATYLTSVPTGAVKGQKLVKVEARDDQDFGINAEISYSVVGGNGSSIFQIDGKTGHIYLNGAVDEIGANYQLIVRAADRGIPPQTATADVLLVVSGQNKYTPEFMASSYQVIVAENGAIGSTILTVSATDRDTGPNGVVRYKIATSSARAELAIDAQTGAITIQAPLDYERVQEYKLNITATDLGFVARHSTAMLTIKLTDVNDNVPQFNQSAFSGYIAENRPANSFVCQMIATDSDSAENAIIEYAIASGSDLNAFAIDKSTGIVRSKIAYDYEAANKFVLQIRAFNPGSPLFSSATLTIHVTGVNEYFPKFVQPVFHFEVSESTSVGTPIGYVQATDQDAGRDGEIFYHFVGASNDRGFAITPNTGVIRVSRNLDRETQSRVVLTVLAKNMGGIRGNDTDEAQVIVLIQDGNDPPEFVQSLYQARISEAAPIGAKVIGVKATDKDVRFQNNQFSYSIKDGNLNNAFKIDPQNGEIETIRLLDRETIDTYELTIAATDTGTPPQTGSALVRVHISDVNDNGPHVVADQLIGGVLENEAPGAQIMTFNATDPDLPPNGEPFAYHLIESKHKDWVTLDARSGVLRTTRSLDREQIAHLDLILEVEDNGRPKQKSVFSVRVNVFDKNDSPSSPRNAKVLVHVLNASWPVGNLVRVAPNDPDTTGDYKCRISKGTTGFSIRDGCMLNVNPNASLTSAPYTFSIIGNDGIHADVTSNISLELVTIDNQTIEHSIAINFGEMNAAHFLHRYYRDFIQIMRETFMPHERFLLYGFQEQNDTLEVAFAVRSEVNSLNYRRPSVLIENLVRKQQTINSLLQQEVEINYKICTKETCGSGGSCKEHVTISSESQVIDSPALIFRGPLVHHKYQCECHDGYVGGSCDRKQDPCVPNPCKAAGHCTRQGFQHHCACPAGRDGKNCELERGVACLNNPCLNGGSCNETPDGSSYFCLCRLGYRGHQCETLVNACRPNPCQHGGHCVSLNPGYECSCSEGRYGKNCEKSTFGFTDLSFMTFPTLDATVNDMAITFATTKANSLLIYNYGTHTGGRSDFVALELVNGAALFSFGGARTAIVKISSQTTNLADGNWYKVAATRNGRVFSLSVASCTDHGEVCDECKPGDVSCYSVETGPTGTLNFNSHPLLIGGVPNADVLLERPGQVHSDDLVGCVHSVSINGRLLNLSQPLEQAGVETVCNRRRLCAGEQNSCGNCVDRWYSTTCFCSNTSLIATDCEASFQPVTLSGDGYIELTVSAKHRRMQLLEHFYEGASWQPSVRPSEETIHPPSVPKVLSFQFRTRFMSGILFYAASNKYFTKVELVNGRITYVSIQANVVNMTDSRVQANDGEWHKITLNSYKGELNVLLDNENIGDILDTAGVHDFLDPYLNFLSLGGGALDLLGDSQNRFQGCFANLTINNEMQPFIGGGSIFPRVHIRGTYSHDCTRRLGLGTNIPPDPLSIGITLVIIFFVVLLIAILASFVAFRLRKQSKEKTGLPGNPPNAHSKQNVTSSILTANGLLNSDNILSRSLHVPESALPYHTNENGDIIRGISGHSLVGPELISKKFKERDLMHGDMQRSQRPDIIDREVLQKPPSVTVVHNHDHVPNDLHSDLPEHYDLENASSIAPSDIDIIYHYKGFREAAAIRKYKVNPPTVSGFHHKHATNPGGGQSTHRHASAHHPSSFPPRGNVNNGVATRPHQSTPLARLSPSSEMSAQQPRILTLHDISGKPLQSALLATTSSSGGVGKDAMHSNSERSLNSPVMSQLSGQSSSSRKASGPPAPGSGGNAGLSLTAEEIERLNARRRTSSLVSTLDAVSSSSEAPRVTLSNHLSHLHHSPVPETHHSSSTTDESGNDSFTCSEIEYDNNSLAGDSKYSKQPVNLNGSNSIPPPSYDGFDSSYRGSMSTLVASDDELGGLYHRPSTGSSSNTALGWDYLLNWGPNFESLAGVFKDIAQLPDNVNTSVSNLRLTNANKPSEEYV